MAFARAALRAGLRPFKLPLESTVRLSRRSFLEASTAAAAPAQAGDIVIDPNPLFEISPYFYMQFMEPLGAADSGVAAAWDYDADNWRQDFVETTRDLAPDVIRWGGLFSRYYRWREGVGPPKLRPHMRNYAWGGWETNRVGTGEFVDLCRRVGAEPLYCVNFLSDGVRRYANTREGNRTGDAREAADWVSYANEPDNRERRAHGVREPYNIRLWQLGNETSYGKEGFSRDEAIERTIEFARAMKQRDPSIRLIGWGDRGREGLWAPELVRRAGEHLNYVAFHMMGVRPAGKDTVLWGLRYQMDPERAWEELRELVKAVERRLAEMEQALRAERAPLGIAITEGHLGLSPHNTNPVLAEWLSAAYHAGTMNLYLRHGEMVKIVTGADFPTTRWTVGSVMIQVPRGISYLMPVGSIMRLFKRHKGSHGVAVVSAPAELDISATRAASRIYLHVLNTNYSRPVRASFSVIGMEVVGGKVFEIAPEDPREYVNQDRPDVFTPQEKPLPRGSAVNWRFPARSVSAVELEVRPPRAASRGRSAV